MFYGKILVLGCLIGILGSGCSTSGNSKPLQTFPNSGIPDAQKETIPLPQVIYKGQE